VEAFRTRTEAMATAAIRSSEDVLAITGPIERSFIVSHGIDYASGLPYSTYTIATRGRNGSARTKVLISGSMQMPVVTIASADKEP
jgi:hypothetical protein